MRKKLNWAYRLQIFKFLATTGLIFFSELFFVPAIQSYLCTYIVEFLKMINENKNKRTKRKCERSTRLYHLDPLTPLIIVYKMCRLRIGGFSYWDGSPLLLTVVELGTLLRRQTLRSSNGGGGKSQKHKKRIQRHGHL